MFDARIFLDELNSARKIFAEHNADYKGDYKIHDIIYQSKDHSQGIEKVFLRLRHIPVNIWGEKEYIVAIKQTELLEVGKRSIIPTKQQFDTKEEAIAFIQENYAEDFEYSYEFDRIGWQYFLGNDGIDLEDIEGHYSIEFKSETEEGLQKLLELFNAKNVIVGPSVVTTKKLLGR